MATTYYDFLIDTADNGSYSYNAKVDVVGVEFGRGRQDRIGIADIGQMTVTLNSENGRFYLLHPNRIAGLTIGRKVKLQAVVEGQRLQVYYGLIEDIIPEFSPIGKPWRARVIVQDSSILLGENPISIPGQRPLGYGALVDQVLNAVGWSTGRDVWVQGEYAQYAIIDQEFPYATLQTVVDSEGGIFFVDRHGIARYWGRGYRDSFRKSATLDISSLVENWTPTEPDVVTEVAVTVNALIDTGAQEAWAGPVPFQLEPRRDKGRMFSVHAPQMVTTWLAAQPDMDYRAIIADTAAGQNNGERRDQWLHVEISGQTPSSCQVFVWNDGGPNNHRVRVTKLRIRASFFVLTDPYTLRFYGPIIPPDGDGGGKPLGSGGGVVGGSGQGGQEGQGGDQGGQGSNVDRPGTTVNDIILRNPRPMPAETWLPIPPSIDPIGGYRRGKYLRKTYTVDSRLITGLVHGRVLGWYLINLLSYPVPDMVVSLKAGTDADIRNVLSLEVWDRIHLTLPDVAIDRDFYIERIGINDQEENVFLEATLFLSPVIGGSSFVEEAQVAAWPNDGSLLDLNGSTNYIDFGDILDQTGPLTMEAWFKVDDISTGRIIIAKDDGTNGWQMSLGDPGSGYRLRFITRELSNIVQDSATLIEAGKWYHAACVFDPDAGTKTIYLNGVQDVQTTGVTGSLVGNTGSLRVGAHSLGGSFFDGFLGELRLWDVARPALDIARYRAKVLSGYEEGLVGYWPVNDGGGTVIESWAGPNKNGAVVGSELWTDPDWASTSA
jgi:hypothetical protein